MEYNTKSSEYLSKINNLREENNKLKAIIT